MNYGFNKKSQFRAALETLGSRGNKRLGVIAALMLALALGSAGLSSAQSDVAVPNAPVPVAAQPSANAPLTDNERAELLKLIADLQARVAKLEAAQAGQPAAAVPDKNTVAGLPASIPKKPDTQDEPELNAPGQPVPSIQKETWGKYTPNFGYKVVDTEFGDMNISIYTYARYLNQRGLNENYTDAFGNIKTVQNRQDFQLNKVQIKFLGWIMSPKLRYFLYAWTSNANQGLGAQVVLAGNLNYSFKKYLTVGGGINGLPGTRSIEGNFPFWLGVDSRLIADEFFRGSYTSGIWVKGEVKDKFRYQVMLGNNLSTLGVPASRLDNHFNTVASTFVWTPMGDFGPGFGDFEDHRKLVGRLGFHYNRSDESKESQPSSDQFENTQLRLSDGTVIFTPDIFGQGVAISDARYRMINFDWGLKYKGYSLEGAYYMRWLDNFRGTATAGIPSIFNQGYQVEAAAMLRPKTLQAYAGYSKIYGDQGNPWDFRVGLNFFPFKNKVVRWNNELLYLHRSPVGYTSVPFAVGGKGLVFHSTWELAF